MIIGTENSDKKNHKQRLRQRFIKSNLEGFHDYEVLELILSYSIIRKDTKQIAKDLIDNFKSLTNVINAPIELLKEIRGIGERTAVFLKLFKEVGSFYLKEECEKSVVIDSPDKLYDFLKYFYKGKINESFMVVFLDNSNKILKTEELFDGTINQTHVYIREIVRKVILYSAKNIILVHNHPSGVLKPSKSDLNLTSKILTTLNLIEVKVLDHLIIGNNEFLSFKNEGFL